MEKFRKLFNLFPQYEKKENPIIVEDNSTVTKT